MVHTLISLLHYHHITPKCYLPLLDLFWMFFKGGTPNSVLMDKACRQRILEIHNQYKEELFVFSLCDFRVFTSSVCVHVCVFVAECGSETL